jgi:hypothetical protein
VPPMELFAPAYLSVLGEVKDGDVFFATFDPSVVWTCRPNRYADKNMFISVEGDCWRTIEHVGNPDTAVVVIHNTKRLTGPEPGC